MNVGVPDAAALFPGQKSVQLTFSSALADNTLYKLTVAGVKDLALNTQTDASLLVG